MSFSIRFSHAITRRPSASIIQGLRAVDTGNPDLALMQAHHDSYVATLRETGATVIELPALDSYPDSVFVEDTALCLPQGAVVMRPGAPSRLGEAAEMAPHLAALYSSVVRISDPRSFIEGGDILVTEREILVGRSARTNAEGIAELTRLVAPWGHSVREVDTPPGVLHFKTDCSLLDVDTVLSTPRLSASGCFAGYKVIDVPDGEEAAANTIRFNDLVLMPAGFPRTRDAILDAGFTVREIGNSECAKLDGGMSCLSLRFTPEMTFNLLAVGQSGRLEHEAILLAASLRQSDPDFAGTLYIAEPQPGSKWQTDPRMSDRTRKVLASLGAQILPFESSTFGSDYPHGNKIEALCALPDKPFLFLDTDTIITGPISSIPFDFARPSASMRRENTWPKVELYGPSLTDTWKSLYDRFGQDFVSSWDTSHPDDYWQRYLYFNAGWFFHQSPHQFGNRFLAWAKEIRSNPPDELVCQELYPWLDQIALPLVIHAFGGGRPGPELDALDGTATCHYRTLPLLYARESDRAVAVLETIAADPDLRPVLRHWGAFKRMLIEGEGAKARALFDRANLPRREQMIRNTLKREGLWVR